ncbi:MAG: CTQ-dependent lysine 6-oxidase LodA [Saprospiraceae bacterium]
MITYEIHPKIGVARVGNSPTDFYLAPESVGGLPIACEKTGEPLMTEDGTYKFEKKYKDELGRIKKQAARFQIFKRAGLTTSLVKLTDDDIEKISWTVHIANKKAVWYTFSELQGDLEFGESNSYKNQGIGVNNPDVKEPEKRKKLIIDPGPRTIDQPHNSVPISRDNIPSDYKFGSFPNKDSGGTIIKTLGELRMDKDGNLITLPGFGNVTGDADITTFRGAAGYWDDIADGYVLATIHFKDGSSINVEPSWLLVGSPKFAPELVNITTLHDTMYNTAVRKMNSDPHIFSGKETGDAFPKYDGYTPLNGFNPDYEVDYTTQIKPIIDRMAGYRWVADIPYLASMTNPNFDMGDCSEEIKEKRMNYFRYFRVPVLPEDYDEWMHKVSHGPNQLFSTFDGNPLLPLNSGDNSVANDNHIYKFETLSPTQFFFMNQWAEGKFVRNKNLSKFYIQQLDEASVGNCTGAPFSPGIETTWIVRNAPIYSKAFTLKLAHFENGYEALSAYYLENGLSISADEAEGQGCEPGDLTKRMAIPWQSDFADCSLQTPNITMPNANQGSGGIQIPPSYQVYWWPPQSPMHVMSGSIEAAEQVLDGPFTKDIITPAGVRIPYQRGIDGFSEMIKNWSRLGFIVNQGSEDYPYFVEKERDFLFFGQLNNNKQNS